MSDVKGKKRFMSENCLVLRENYNTLLFVDSKDETFSKYSFVLTAVAPFMESETSW